MGAETPPLFVFPGSAPLSGVPPGSWALFPVWVRCVGASGGPGCVFVVVPLGGSVGGVLLWGVSVRGMRLALQHHANSDRRKEITCELGALLSGFRRIVSKQQQLGATGRKHKAAGSGSL